VDISKLVAAAYAAPDARSRIATMAIDRTALTYRDYEALPDDGRRYQILDGTLDVTPSPSPDHQDVLANLHAAVRDHVKVHGRGRTFFAPVDVILADNTVVQPDLVFLDAERTHLVSPRGIEGAPTLVVEVLSPSTAAIDRGMKSRLYARHGVAYYWIVDVDARAIEAYELIAGGYRLAARGQGQVPIGLPPFEHLGLLPDSLWPRGSEP
jgi:Uma2 family endonuclease